MRHRIKPGPGKVAVKLLEESETTSMGLWIPPSARNDGHLGRVVAVSEPYTLDGAPMQADYAVGDLVAFGKYIGTEVTVGSGNKRETFLIFKEQEILCEIVEEADDAPTT